MWFAVVAFVLLFSLFHLPFSAFVMSRTCAALNPPRKFRHIWTPCRRPHLPRDRFCARHRAAINGAVLGLLQIELKNARHLAHLDYASETATAANASDTAAPKTRRRKKRVRETAVCPTCGAVWEAEPFIRQLQLIETEKEYLFEARPTVRTDSAGIAERDNAGQSAGETPAHAAE